MDFIQNIANNNMTMFYIMVGNLIFTTILIILFAIQKGKYKRLNARYERFMKKIGQGEKIEEYLAEFIEGIHRLKSKDEDIEKSIERIENNLKKCVQKVGLVRYNAYNDTGSDLSFTFALMDSLNNGIVVNGLYSRDSSSIFAKPLLNGETKYSLSAEEIQAIDIAKASSNFGK